VLEPGRGGQDIGVVVGCRREPRRILAIVWICVGFSEPSEAALAPFWRERAKSAYGLVCQEFEPPPLFELASRERSLT
jgi:hypothetical protein